MTGEEAASVTVRAATADDYAAFVRLQPEMGTGDPIASPETWASVIAPATWVAAAGAAVAGYCYVQEYTDAGYVRNLVVDPTVRRQGVGRRLMQATAAQLRAHGKTSWRLNVKPDNVAAIGLYESVGLRAAYASKAFRLPWPAVAALPGSGATVSAASPDRDVVLEDAFHLSRGQLTQSRGQGRTIFEARSRDALLGVADFNPRFPGAFPFRVTDPRVASDLLTAMRALVPNDDAVFLTTEDDEPLAALLLTAGAHLRMTILHMTGAL